MKINLIGWILSGLILLLLFFVVMLLKHPVKLIFTGKKANANIVGFHTIGNQQAPIARFGASNGKTIEVTSRSYSQALSIKPGTTVTVIYNEAHPADAQLLMWREFTMVAVLLGFIVFILVLWICALLLSPGSGFDDPLHILSWGIARYHLSPSRLPVFFILFCVITGTGLGTYFNFNSSINLRATGIRATGHVTGVKRVTARSNQNGQLLNSGLFAIISYTDLSGNTHNIRRSLAKPLSRLQQGDMVEVIYPRTDPANAVVNTWDELYFLPTFFALMFVAFLSMLLLILNGNIKI